MKPRLHLAAALAATFAGALPAQLEKGITAPAFDFKKSWNDAPDSFGDLRGKLVLLEFFATW